MALRGTFGTRAAHRCDGFTHDRTQLLSAAPIVIDAACARGAANETGRHAFAVAIRGIPFAFSEGPQACQVAPGPCGLAQSHDLSKHPFWPASSRAGE